MTVQHTDAETCEAGDATRSPARAPRTYPERKAAALEKMRDALWVASFALEDALDAEKTAHVAEIRHQIVEADQIVNSALHALGLLRRTRTEEAQR